MGFFRGMLGTQMSLLEAWALASSRLFYLISVKNVKQRLRTIATVDT